MNSYFKKFLFLNFKNELEDNKNTYIVFISCLLLLYFNNVKILAISLVLGLVLWMKYVQKMKSAKNNKARHERLSLPMTSNELIFFLYLEGLIEALLCLVWVSALIKIIHLTKSSSVPHLHIYSYLPFLLSFWIACFSVPSKLNEIKKQEISKQLLVAYLRSAGLLLSGGSLFTVILILTILIKFSSPHAFIFLGILGASLLFLFITLKMNKISHLFQEHSYFNNFKYNWIYDTPVVIVLAICVGFTLLKY